MVEVDLWECLAYPLAFFADGAIGRGLGFGTGKPIEDGQPRQREQVIGQVEQFEPQTRQHGGAL